jgi:hypothetical protein
MILISKDDSERIVEQFVVKLCENNNSTELATESMDILNDEIYKKVLLGSLLRSYKDEFKDVDNGEFDMRVKLMSGVSCVFDEDCHEEDMIPKFKGLFHSENTDAVWNNPKLQFAFDQFVSAFYTYELFEKKYPKISKNLEIIL